MAFTVWNCRQLGSGIDVLVADYSVRCDDLKHATYQLVSVLVIIAFGLGVPVLFGVRLLRQLRNFKSEADSGGSRFVVRRVAEALMIDDEQAAEAISEITLGESHSFLVNAYTSHLFWWESVDMLRKLGKNLCVRAVVQRFWALLLKEVSIRLQYW
eukprot:COSAG06_NODE_2910_length_6103_cov_2.350600_3_plen_156_part_00